MPFKGCDGYTTDELPVGDHCITCQFTLTESSKPLYQEKFKISIRPTSMQLSVV